MESIPDRLGGSRGLRHNYGELVEPGFYRSFYDRVYYKIVESSDHKLVIKSSSGRGCSKVGDEVIQGLAKFLRPINPKIESEEMLRVGNWIKSEIEKDV